MVELSKALPKYAEILEGKRKPRFKTASLEGKIKEAFKMLESCNLCERVCGVDRTVGKLGYCRTESRLSVDAHYVDREEDLGFFVPIYNVFLLGCVLRCVFCQNYETSQVKCPREMITEKQLAKVIDSKSSCKIVGFVGGDPLQQLPFILKTLSFMEQDVPIMWNSSFYMTEKSMGLLRNTIDVYSPDFKYGMDECARRLSDVSNYTSVIKRNLLLAAEDSEMIIRHLVMPNHIDCCSKPVIDFIAGSFGDTVPVHLMYQYRPQWKVRKNPEKYQDINRKLRKKEFQEVLSYADKKGLTYVVE